MTFNSAEFEFACGTSSQLPQSTKPEVIFPAKVMLVSHHLSINFVVERLWPELAQSQVKLQQLTF